MIFTSSVIAGFRAILGSACVQLAMAVTIACFLDLTKTPFHIDQFDTLAEDNNNDIVKKMQK